MVRWHNMAINPVLIPCSFVCLIEAEGALLVKVKGMVHGGFLTMEHTAYSKSTSSFSIVDQ
jgi:hypothetical protein